MGALTQERRETLAGLANRIGPRNADRVETVLARRLGEQRLDAGGVLQKSRSA
jgi:hypothetical protein